MARSCARVVVPGLLVCAFGIGCKDDSITGTGEPSVAFVAGAGATDTIQTELLEELVVEVRGVGGRLAAGIPVQFTTIPGPYNPAHPYHVYVSRTEATAFGGLVDATTDAAGRAAVRVRLGGSARTAIVIATVPSLNLADTTTYTILPGAATQVLAGPDGWVLHPGGTLALGARVTDRFGNTRSDPVTFSVTSGGVTLQGSTVAAQTSGSATIVAQALGLSDVITLAVVPPGPLAVSYGGGVGTVNLDGREFRVLTHAPSKYVRWAPDGSMVAFDNGGPVPAMIVTLQGDVRPVRPSSADADAEMYPAFSPDGAWVYLGVRAKGSGAFRLWRARRDGTDAAPLMMSSPEDDFYPSPSPDGTRLAYVRRNGGGSGYLRILDLTTGAVTRIDVPGYAPAWSPLGDLIAYVDIDAGSVLKVMSPDGTGQRQVSPAGDYMASVAWSPDGRWLIASAPGAPQLTDVVTGVTIPIGYLATMVSPSWKP